MMRIVIVMWATTYFSETGIYNEQMKRHTEQGLGERQTQDCADRHTVEMAQTIPVSEEQCKPGVHRGHSCQGRPAGFNFIGAQTQMKLATRG